MSSYYRADFLSNLEEGKRIIGKSSENLRSLQWMKWLNVLSEDPKNWQTILEKNRKDYGYMINELTVNPNFENASLDPNIHNPLSQCQESSWNQYFEDSELRKQITLDVDRSFPEVEFFNEEHIKALMIRILFCYARKYQTLCYVQGMHEILAPVVYVITKDCSQSGLDEINLLNKKYLEHDSYILFEELMKRLLPWYESDSKCDKNISKGNIQTKPFARPQDIGPAAKIVRRLTSIHDNLLRKYELDVSNHLNRLEISPQLYGIRWARLMFGREFKFCDLLILWDSIFFESQNDRELILIEYIMIAMLSVIKYKLLNSDYVSALNYLMRFPRNIDVRYVVQLALFYKDPYKNRRPILHPTYPADSFRKNENSEPQRDTNSSVSSNTGSQENKISETLANNKGNQESVKELREDNVKSLNQRKSRIKIPNTLGKIGDKLIRSRESSRTRTDQNNFPPIKSFSENSEKPMEDLRYSRLNSEDQKTNDLELFYKEKLLKIHKTNKECIKKVQDGLKSIESLQNNSNGLSAVSCFENMKQILNDLKMIEQTSKIE